MAQRKSFLKLELDFYKVLLINFRLRVFSCLGSSFIFLPTDMMVHFTLFIFNISFISHGNIVHTSAVFGICENIIM